MAAAASAFIAAPRMEVARRGLAIGTAAQGRGPAIGGIDAAAALGDQAVMGLALAAVALTAAAARRARRSPVGQRAPGVACACAPGQDYGEDLTVPDDYFVCLGLAHCFEQSDKGKLKDVWVLEPISASTVEVLINGADTSYEAFMGSTVGEVLAQDTGALPEALLCGHEVQWGEKLEFRTGCAARTWLRDHARDVVRKMVPVGEVRTGFNTSTKNKRILNFVNEVKDSDNVKQDMSIDVYGRDEEKEETDEEKAIADLYNV